jgi:hypothetical protein
MTISPQKIANHVDEVAAILDVIADIANMKAARVPEVVVAGVRAALGILTDLEDGTIDSRDVDQRVAILRDELKTTDARHDAALAARFPVDRFDVGGTD